MNLDLLPAFSLACEFDGFNYLTSMHIMCIGPIVVSAILLCVYVVENIKTSGNRVTLTAADKGTMSVPAELKNKFNATEIKSLRLTFKTFDTSGDGYIDLLVSNRFSVVKSSWAAPLYCHAWSRGWLPV